MIRHTPMGRGLEKIMPSSPEELPITGGEQLNDMTANVVRLREKMQTADDVRFRYLALVLTVCCIGVIALVHADHDFFRFGGIYIWMALISAFKAIGNVFVARRQVKLALAILAQESLRRRLRNRNECASIRDKGRWA